MLQRGDRVEYIGEGFGTPKGTLGTYQGGADYVPGWDAGKFEVLLDHPNEYGHKYALHWTYDEVCRYWQKVT